MLVGVKIRETEKRSTRQDIRRQGSPLRPCDSPTPRQIPINRSQHGGSDSSLGVLRNGLLRMIQRGGFDAETAETMSRRGTGPRIRCLRPPLRPCASPTLRQLPTNRLQRDGNRIHFSFPN